MLDAVNLDHIFFRSNIHRLKQLESGMYGKQADKIGMASTYSDDNISCKIVIDHTPYKNGWSRLCIATTLSIYHTKLINQQHKPCVIRHDHQTISIHTAL